MSSDIMRIFNAVKRNDEVSEYLKRRGVDTIEISIADFDRMNRVLQAQAIYTHDILFTGHDLETKVRELNSKVADILGETIITIESQKV